MSARIKPSSRIVALLALVLSLTTGFLWPKTGGKDARASSANGSGLGIATAHQNVLTSVNVLLIGVGGQSLGLGGGADAAVAQALLAAGFELCNDAGTYVLPATGNAWGLCPIQEFGRAFIDAAPGDIVSDQYPENYLGPSLDRQFQVQASAMLVEAGYPSLSFVNSSTGQGGAAFTQVGYGGTGNAFDSGYYELAEISSLVRAIGKIPVVAAYLWIHGEEDCALPVAQYQANIVTQCAAVQTYYAAITGQTRPIPCLVHENDARCQSSAPVVDYSGQAQLLASQAAAGVVGAPQLLGGEYWMPRVSVGNDWTHMQLPGYQQLGALAAEVYFHDERVIEGYETTRWESFQPIKVTSTDTSPGTPDPGTFTISGNTVTVHFHVPNPPIVIDTTHGQSHQSGTYSVWASCYGAGAWVGGLQGTPVQCNSATLQSDGISIAFAFNAPFDTFEYIYTPDSPTGGTGNINGRVGCFRDSGQYTDLSTGQPIYHWLSKFFQGTTTDGGPFSVAGGLRGTPATGLGLVLIGAAIGRRRGPRVLQSPNRPEWPRRTARAGWRLDRAVAVGTIVNVCGHGLEDPVGRPKGEEKQPTVYRKNARERGVSCRYETDRRQPHTTRASVYRPATRYAARTVSGRTNTWKKEKVRPK
jgi:hypothetical protein